jgi:hypothetical protein
MRMTILFTPLVFLVATSGTLRTASAAGKSATRAAAEKAAKKACIVGDVRKGIDLLGDLFVETNDPTYIYNQGRCFEQNHKWEEAVDRFQEYLRKIPNLPEDEKSNVNYHISDCESKLGKLAPPPASPIAAPVPRQPPTPTLPLAPPPTTDNLATSPATAAAEPRSSSRLRTAGVITAAGGALALVGGLVCNLRANSLATDLSGSTYDRSKASQRDTYVTLGWVGYGVGAAALVTEATLYILGGRSTATAEASTSVSLTPVLLPGLASLSLRGTY